MDNDDVIKATLPRTNFDDLVYKKDLVLQEPTRRGPIGPLVVQPMPTEEQMAAQHARTLADHMRIAQRMRNSWGPSRTEMPEGLLRSYGPDGERQRAFCIELGYEAFPTPGDA